MSEVPAFLEANARYAEQFDAGDLPAPPARKVAILTCMDARLDPAHFLGLRNGDAHIIRNAGGRADLSALRSLIISEQLLGTNEIVVIHHTDCGMLSFKNEDLHRILADRFGHDASDHDFMPFDDLEQSVRDDIAAIRASKFIPDDIAISGFIYEVETGRLRPVE